MANKRIPELINILSPSGNDKISLYDSQGDFTGHVNVSDLISGQNETTNINWSNILIYNTGDIVKSEGKFWESILVGDNLGNVPQENANWTEVSKSESGLVLYVPGVFLNDEVYCINQIPNRNGFWLVRLVNATRPFNSVDFTTEYNNGDWAVVGDKNKYGVDTGAADAYILTLNEPITVFNDGMTILFKASNTNTGGTATIDIDGLGVKSIVTPTGVAPTAGQITNLTLIAYDATIGKFQLVGSGGGGGGGGIALTDIPYPVDFQIHSDSPTSDWGIFKGSIDIDDTSEVLDPKISSALYETTENGGATTVTHATIAALKTWVDTNITLATDIFQIRTTAIFTSIGSGNVKFKHKIS